MEDAESKYQEVKGNKVFRETDRQTETETETDRQTEYILKQLSYVVLYRMSS